MKYTWIVILLLISCNTTSSVESNFLQSDEVKLNSPIVKMNSAMFQSSEEIELLMDYDGAKIYFTLDGSEPTQDAQLYTSKIKVTESSVLKAKAVHEALKSSETIEIDLIKVKPMADIIQEVQLIPEPSEKYMANGKFSLFDLKKGKFDFKDNAWLGFDGGSLEITVSFEQAIDVESISISMLRNHGSWIFLPEEVHVHLADKHKSVSIDIPIGDEENLMKYINVPIAGKAVKDVRIEILGMKEIPDWHVGKGTTPWLFIDEIIIN